MSHVEERFSLSERLVDRLLPWLTPEQRLEAVATLDVVAGVAHAASSGMVLTIALAGLALVSRGGRQALFELKHHVLYIHPLIWVLTLMSVCMVMVFRDAKAMPKVRAAVVDPILSFVVHVFGAALGAIPVLALSKWGGLLPADPTAGFAVLLVFWLLSLVMALMAQVGLVGGSRPDLKVREWSQLLAFFFLFVSVLLLVALSGEGKSSEEGLSAFFKAVTG